MTRVLLCSPGVRLAYEPQRSPSYGVWIEVRLGTKGWPSYKVMRGRKGWATEAEGVTAYHAACREIAANTEYLLRSGVERWGVGRNEFHHVYWSATSFGHYGPPCPARAKMEIPWVSAQPLTCSSFCQ